VHVERAVGRVALALEGELDLETAPRFRERLADAEPGAETVVVDLRRVRFIDSCGIGELVGAQQRAHREGRRLVVVKGEGTEIDQVLHIAALDKTLETTTDTTEVSPDRTVGQGCCGPPGSPGVIADGAPSGN
jgi:anti-anti-sigma factor